MPAIRRRRCQPSHRRRLSGSMTEPRVGTAAGGGDTPGRAGPKGIGAPWVVAHAAQSPVSDPGLDHGEPPTIDGADIAPNAESVKWGWAVDDAAAIDRHRERPERRSR